MTTLVLKSRAPAAEAVREVVAWLRQIRAALRPRSSGSGSDRASEIERRVDEGRRRIRLSALDPRL